MVRRVAVFGLALAAIGLIPVTSASQTRSATESTLHAAFTYNFAKFAQWPDSRATSGPLTFCVLDDEAVENALEELIRGSSIQGREVAIVRGFAREQIPLCHLVYLPDIAAADPDFLADALRASVLIVGAGRDFAQRGGVIGLFVEGGHMQFAVNLGLARRAGIMLSSQMLSLATIVGDE